MSSTPSRIATINKYILDNKKLFGSLALIGIGASIAYYIYNSKSSVKDCPKSKPTDKTKTTGCTFPPKVITFIF